jgi:hypothetical protein
LRAVTQNPEGLLLLAAGAVLLMRKGGTSGHAVGGQRFTQAGDAATKTAGAADYTSSSADRASEAVGAIVSSASAYTETARRSAADRSSRALRQAHDKYQGTLERVLRDKPLLVPLAGAAAGAALAAAFPASELERQTLGPIGAQVSQAASKAGDQLKEAVSTAGETLRHAVDERELNPEGLKKVATDVAGAFSSSMTGEAHQATSDGESSSRADPSGNGQ